MRILYTITKSEIGGAQVHVFDLAKNMKDLGYAVAIVSCPGGWLEEEATKNGIRFYENKYFANSFNLIKILKSFFVIKKIVDDFKPDLVHCHSSFAGVITRLVVRLKIPTIFTAHSFAFTDGASFFRKVLGVVIEKMMSFYTDKIICVSKYDMSLALRYKIAKIEKLCVVYNGVLENPFTQEKQNIIITNGRLAYPKDYNLLLDAYKLSNTPLSLKIISDGPDRVLVEEKIKKLGLENKVTLLGNLNNRQEVFKEISKANFFILISKHEGLPISIIEAMSSGLPVIASSVGGIPEEIDESCGVLVKNNKEEISKAINHLSDIEVQNKMGENAKEKFKKLFTINNFITNTENIYKELVSENNLNRF